MWYTTDMGNDDYYTAKETAEMLRISDRRVRQLAESGELAGERTPEGWKLRKDSVHRYRDERRMPRGSGWPSDAIQRITTLERKLGQLEGELRTKTELPEAAQSALQEQLDRERERADRLERELAKERARHDALMAQVVERIPKLEAPQGGPIESE